MFSRQSDPSIVELADRHSDDLEPARRLQASFRLRAGGGARLTIGEAMP